MSLAGTAEKRALGVFEGAMGALKGGPHSVSDLPLNKLMAHKGLHSEINKISGQHLDQGVIESKILGHMNSSTNVLGAGDLNGKAGLNRMVGAWDRLRGGSQYMKGDLDIAEANLKGLTSDHPDYAAHMAHYKQLKGQMNSPGRYGSAAWDMAQGYRQWMWGGSLGQKAAKTGLTAGAVVGAGGLARGVTSGGSMFYDGDGRRDIAGIPFI